MEAALIRKLQLVGCILRFFADLFCRKNQFSKTPQKALVVYLLDDFAGFICVFVMILNVKNINAHFSLFRASFFIALSDGSKSGLQFSPIPEILSRLIVDSRRRKCIYCADKQKVVEFLNPHVLHDLSFFAGGSDFYKAATVC